MSILASEVKFYKAQSNNDTTGNGGRISSNVITDAVLNNLFPNVTNAERLTGKTRYRKMFIRNLNTGGLTLQNTYAWIGVLSTSADYFRMKEGSDTDTQASASGYTNWAGAGTLASPAGSGDSSLVIDFDAPTGVYSGENVWVHVDDSVSEVDVKVVGTPSWNGSEATINISGELGANFPATTTLVSTMVDLGDIVSAVSAWTENSASGTYDESTYPLTTYNVGTVSDSWTLTFSGASNFSVSGAYTGSLGSGEITSDFQPTNGSSYYFLIDKDGWGGSWANGETVTFTTTQAGYGIWLQEVVPAAIDSYSNNTVRVDWKGESA